MLEKTQQLGYSTIPRSAVLAPSSMAGSLKAPRGKGGATGVKTFPNSPEEQLPRHSGGSDSRVRDIIVYVLRGRIQEVRLAVPLRVETRTVSICQHQMRCQKWAA